MPFSQIQRRKESTICSATVDLEDLLSGPEDSKGVNISLDDLFGGGFDGIFNQFFDHQGGGQLKVTILSIVTRSPSK